MCYVNNVNRTFEQASSMNFRYTSVELDMVKTIFISNQFLFIIPDVSFLNYHFFCLVLKFKLIIILWF